MASRNYCTDLLFGVAVGDALGVPVEFKSRETISLNPVTDMIGFGTHCLPAGTWSDDSSMTFCLAEALTEDFDVNVLGQYFVNWYHDNYWTPRGEVFDIGIATREAIDRIASGVEPELAGGIGERDNGNGSLIRIAPLLFYLQDKPMNERFEITRSVSSLTHRHIRSVFACFYYLEFGRLLLEGKDKFEAYECLQAELASFLASVTADSREIAVFNRLLKSKICEEKISEIGSSGYVIDTLEASIWCLLTTDSYKEAVLKAVNLGDDSDSTGAVTGGLAGLLYGVENIPESWLKQIARRGDIEDLAKRLQDKLGRR